MNVLDSHVEKFALEMETRTLARTSFQIFSVSMVGMCCPCCIQQASDTHILAGRGETWGLTGNMVLDVQATCY